MVNELSVIHLPTLEQQSFFKRVAQGLTNKFITEYGKDTIKAIREGEA